MTDDREAARKQMIADAKATIEEAHRVLARADEVALVAWLTSIRAHPEQLDPAPETDQGAAIEHRRLHETHQCGHCGKPATVAFIAGTEAGMRWLDLCAPHGVAVQNVVRDWDAEDEEA